MPKTRKPYPPEFREQLVALVQAGRTPEDLAREFEPTAQSISNWVAQADRDAGRRTDGLTSAERSGLRQLRRENRQLKLERDILLTALIHAIHRRSGGAYGAPIIRAELADDHQRHVGTKRVARLMRAAGLPGLHPRPFVPTTVSDPTADRAVDQVDRQFAADGPDRLWVADITYVPTGRGFSISPWCSMSGRGALSGGRWSPTSRPSASSRP